MGQDRDTINIEFQAILPAETMTSLHQVSTKSDDSKPSTEKEICPTFGPRPVTTSKDFNFSSEDRGFHLNLTWVKKSICHHLSEPNSVTPFLITKMSSHCTMKMAIFTRLPI